ncbi:MAG: L-seryl-tRNA(Sec) selenium transferase [Gemmataceae bacterium]|nr:L-seryl-tRNA(Sec) selenium transferase [Gemmataceae bacterium]
MSNPYRAIPSVHELLEAFTTSDGTPTIPRELVLRAIRDVLEQARAFVTLGGDVPEFGEIVEWVRTQIQVNRRSGFRRVINATGIVLHTNLGRAPMAEAAAQAAYEAARFYLNLELDLATGKRSSRQQIIRELLVDLTGAESATVVNNCAAATVLVLRALAAGKEVIVSRGQLIEIGGSFRIPEIMAVSGAILREVGTTNIVRIADYERAITPQTAALMRIHTSNYRIRGFTQSPGLDELVSLGRRTKLPVIDDIGSGVLFDFTQEAFAEEPRIRNSVKRGADVVLFSGDKLLGGPQAGIILGRKDIIEQLERDPLMRAFRLDKMTLAALQATLQLYYSAESAREQIPVLRLIHLPLESLRDRATRLANELAAIPGVHVDTLEGTSFVGGGSLPEEAIPTWVVSLSAADIPEEKLAERLRLGEPAVLACRRDGRVLMDVRTIFPEQERELVEAVRHAVRALQPSVEATDEHDQD